MAIFHLSTKPLKRSDGRSATASIAYRAACKVVDERTGKKYDYSRKKGVVVSRCFALNDSAFIDIDRSKLWNKAELSEKRKDARTAREIVVSLPFELLEQAEYFAQLILSEKDSQYSKHQVHINLVEGFCAQLAEEYNCAIDYAIHLPDKAGDNRNHHAHIMMTTRNIVFDTEGFYLKSKTHLELSNTKLKSLGLPRTQDQIKNIRSNWCDIVNAYLDDYCIDATVDHRSHMERGLQTKPTIKIGWKCTQLERRGLQTDKGNLNREIRNENQEIESLVLEVNQAKEEQKAQEVQFSRELESKKQAITEVYDDFFKMARHIMQRDTILDKDAQVTALKDSKLHQRYGDIQRFFTYHNVEDMCLTIFKEVKAKHNEMVIPIEEEVVLDVCSNHDMRVYENALRIFKSEDISVEESLDRAYDASKPCDIKEFKEYIEHSQSETLQQRYNYHKTIIKQDFYKNINLLQHNKIKQDRENVFHELFSKIHNHIFQHYQTHRQILQGLNESYGFVLKEHADRKQDYIDAVKDKNTDIVQMKKSILGQYRKENNEKLIKQICHDICTDVWRYIDDNHIQTKKFDYDINYVISDIIKNNPHKKQSYLYVVNDTNETIITMRETIINSYMKEVDKRVKDARQLDVNNNLVIAEEKLTSHSQEEPQKETIQQPIVIAKTTQSVHNKTKIPTHKPKPRDDDNDFSP